MSYIGPAKPYEAPCELIPQIVDLEVLGSIPRGGTTQKVEFIRC